LDSIGFKWSDPYIISTNPHIHDAEDIFLGEVLKIIAQPFHDDYDFSL
jgi:hypothetical protein